MKSSLLLRAVLAVALVTTTSAALARQAAPAAPGSVPTPPPASSVPAATVQADPVPAAATPAAASDFPKHTKKKKPANHGTSFAGTIGAVDAKEMSVTVAGKKEQTVYVDSKSHLEKDGKPAVFADLKAGEKLQGTSHKEKDGKLTVVHASIGEKAASAESKKSKKAAPAQ